MGKKLKSIVALICTLGLIMMAPACTLNEKGITIEILTDSSTSYSYTYFGSYPQREVVSQASECGTYLKDWSTEDDYIIDATTYDTLKNLSEDQWDTYGDTTIGNDKYRRINKSNATGSKDNDVNFYSWSDSSTYHYFKYEPIKWRVLEQTNGEAFIIS